VKNEVDTRPFDPGGRRTHKEAHNSDNINKDGSADGLDLALRLVKSGRERDVLSFVENPAFNELK